MSLAQHGGVACPCQGTCCCEGWHLMSLPTQPDRQRPRWGANRPCPNADCAYGGESKSTQSQARSTNKSSPLQCRLLSPKAHFLGKILLGCLGCKYNYEETFIVKDFYTDEVCSLPSYTVPYALWNLGFEPC